MAFALSEVIERNPKRHRFLGIESLECYTLFHHAILRTKPLNVNSRTIMRAVVAFVSNNEAESSPSTKVTAAAGGVGSLLSNSESVIQYIDPAQRIGHRTRPRLLRLKLVSWIGALVEVTLADVQSFLCVGQRGLKLCGVSSCLDRGCDFRCERLDSYCSGAISRPRCIVHSHF
jgi:hypothetical protein